MMRAHENVCGMNGFGEKQRRKSSNSIYRNNDKGRSVHVESKHLRGKNSVSGQSALTSRRQGPCRMVTGLDVEGMGPRHSDPGRQMKSDLFLGDSRIMIPTS